MKPDRFDRRLAAQRRDLAAKKPDQWTCRHCLRRFVVPELTRLHEEKCR